MFITMCVTASFQNCSYLHKESVLQKQEKETLTLKHFFQIEFKIWVAKCLFWRNLNKVFFGIHFQVGQDRQMYLRFFSCYVSWCWLKATLFRAIRFVSLWRLAKVRMTLACSCLMWHVCLVFKMIWKKQIQCEHLLLSIMLGKYYSACIMSQFWSLWNEIRSKQHCFDIETTSKFRRRFDMRFRLLFRSRFDVVVPTG